MTTTKPLIECNQIIPAQTLVEVREGEGGEWKRGLTTGGVGVGGGVFTHLWVNTLDYPSPCGFPIKDIRIVRI